ncbi:MAG: T9SS type A sorting domain-containing protein, partial [Candidatus Kapaibacterium sp.]
NLGQAYIPQFNINGIGNLLPGQGYQVFLNKTDSLVYPANEQLKASFRNSFFTPTEAEVLKNSISNTGSNMTIILEIENPDNKFELAVFNGNGMITGSARLIGNLAVLTVWNDDDYISDKANDRTLRFMAYDKVSASFSDVNCTILNDMIDNGKMTSLSYNDNMIIYAKGKIEAVKNSLLMTVSPNPFVDKCEVELYVRESTDGIIKMYNSMGKEVYTKDTGLLTAGKHIFQISAVGLASGEYNIIFTGNGKSESLKLILSK